MCPAASSTYRPLCWQQQGDWLPFSVSVVEQRPHCTNETLLSPKSTQQKDRHMKQSKKKILKSECFNALCGMGKNGINQGAEWHPCSSVVTLLEFSCVNLFCNLTVKMLKVTYKTTTTMIFWAVLINVILIKRDFHSFLCAN